MPAFVPVCLIAASLLLLFSLPALVQRTLFLYAGLACAFPGIPALYVCGAVLTAFIAVGAVFVLVCSLLMCIGWRRAAAQAVRGDETVLVLGCRVYSDHLSNMLIGRLTTAYALLCRYPKMQCVVSGGQGGDEPCTEAAAMKRWLVERGIQPERIIEEGNSRSTIQNFSYSAKRMRECGLSFRVIVATDFFHQFRSSLLAKREGFDAFGAASIREPLLLPGYWLREMPGILCAWVLLLRRKGASYQ